MKVILLLVVSILCQNSDIIKLKDLLSLSEQNFSTNKINIYFKNKLDYNINDESYINFYFTNINSSINISEINFETIDNVVEISGEDNLLSKLRELNVNNNNLKTLIIYDNDDKDQNEFINKIMGLQLLTDDFNIIFNSNVNNNNVRLAQDVIPTKKMHRVLMGCFAWGFVFVTFYVLYLMFTMDYVKDSLVYSNIISNKTK